MSTNSTNPVGPAPSLLERLRMFRFDKKPLLGGDAHPLRTVEDSSTDISTEPPSSQSNESQLVGNSDQDTNKDIAADIDRSEPPKKEVQTSTCENSLDDADPVILESKPDCVGSGDGACKSSKGNRSKRVKPILDEDGMTKEEKKLSELSADYPGSDLLHLQDVLSRADWDVTKAKENLKKSLSDESSNNSTNTKKRSLGDCNGMSKAAKRKKRQGMDDLEEDSESDEDDDGGYQKKKLFDSDTDSEEEISNELTGDKLKVFEFLSKASISELQLMQHCSKKRAELIIECRPFEGWKPMMKKLQEKSVLGCDFLNYAQALLHSRDVVAALIEKCCSLANKIEKAIAVGLTSVRSQPSILPQHLKLSDYQLVGLNWLLIMDSHNVNGILADEMGLGKTVQVIAFLAYLKENKQNISGKPHLIVVPSSTLENWRNEFERWCPSMNIATYYGSQEDRKCQRLLWAKNGFEGTEVILTTYGMLSSVDDKKRFCVSPFHYAVFDEAHMLKNMASQRYKDLVKINAPHRILLTGTPMQNNLLELMSLLAFVMPKMFKNKEDNLKALFAKGGKQSKAENEDPAFLPEFEQIQITQAKRIMKPFVLRRLKADVLKDLPIKTDRVHYSAMTLEQEEKYKELVKTFSKQARKILQDEQTDASENGMAMYMKLRRLANHPLLLRYHFTDDIITDMAKRLQNDSSYKDTVFDYIYTDLSLMSDFELHQMCLNFKSCVGLQLPPKLFGQSGKLTDMESILKNLHQNEHRVLIFSQFVIVLDILEEHFKICGYKFHRLDGNTPVTLRQELIDDFNKNPSIFIFLLSTRAGGLGINLTAADTVIIHDVDPNPHNDKQAEDRCHRIGQTKPVTVIRLVCKNTIEENIFNLAQEKLQLEREISGKEENEQSEKKCVASLLKQHLGIDKNSPSKNVSL